MSQLCFDVFKTAKLNTHPFYIHVATFVNHAGGSIKGISNYSYDKKTIIKGSHCD